MVRKTGGRKRALGTRAPMAIPGGTERSMGAGLSCPINSSAAAASGFSPLLFVRRLHTGCLTTRSRSAFCQPSPSQQSHSGAKRRWRRTDARSAHFGPGLAQRARTRAHRPRRTEPSENNDTRRNASNSDRPRSALREAVPKSPRIRPPKTPGTDDTLERVRKPMPQEIGRRDRRSVIH